MESLSFCFDERLNFSHLCERFSDSPNTELDQILQPYVGDLSLDDHIYRIMSFNRLKEMVEGNCSGFIKPKKWEDPFEAVFLRYDPEEHAGQSLCAFRDGVYAQCWSLAKDSDAMWRVFARRTCGDRSCCPQNEHQFLNGMRRCDPYVQIETTVRDLMAALVRGCKDNGKPNSIGLLIASKVRYYEQNRICNRLRKLYREWWMDNIGQHFNDPREMLEAFYIKRKAFAHEKEVRFVAVAGHWNQGGFFPENQNSSGRDDGLLKIPFDAKSCEMNIVLDPWTSLRRDADCILHMIEELVWNRTRRPRQVRRSVLYSSSIYD